MNRIGHRRTRVQEIKVLELALYSGRDLIGTVIDRAWGYEAIDAKGHRLGAFHSRKAAISAIGDASGGVSP